MIEQEKNTKILYVCPFAHRTGHPPQAVKNEPAALIEQGAELSVCTFRGVLDQHETPPMPHSSVVSTKARFPGHSCPLAECPAGGNERFTIT